MTNSTCKTCRWWAQGVDFVSRDDDQPDLSISCIRTGVYFPGPTEATLVIDAECRVTSNWKYREPDDWCGEHESVEDVEEYRAFADRFGPASKEGVAWARKQAERLGLDHKGQPNKRATHSARMRGLT